MATVAVAPPVSTEDRLLETFIESLCAQTGIDLDKSTDYADKMVMMIDDALNEPRGRVTIGYMDQTDELYASVIDVIMPHDATATRGTAHAALEALMSERTGEWVTIVHDVLADGCGMTVTATTKTMRLAA